MASRVAIKIREAAAIERIAAAIGVDVDALKVGGARPDMETALLLEAIADAAEAQAAPPQAEARRPTRTKRTA